MKPHLDAAELHRVAATECAGLANRLIRERREAIAGRFADARQTFEAAVSALESSVSEEGLSPEDIERLAERLSSNAALASVRDELQEVRDQLREERAANQRLTETLDEACTDLERARAELRTQQEQTTAPPDMARMSAEFDRTLDELRREHLTAVRDQALTHTSLPLDALLTIFNAMTRAGTISEVLSELVHGLAREFSRVLLFTIHDNRLDAVEHRGFDFGDDVSKVTFPLSTDSLISAAVRSGRLESVFPGLQRESRVQLPFGGTPACAVAVPLSVGGASIAVIYADDSDTPEFAIAVPQTRAKFAEILQRHALPMLVMVEAQQRLAAELREFAKLLVEEMEYLHAADVNAGKNTLERQHALREVLARSRRLWAERLGRNNESFAGFLDEHMRAVVNARSEAVFARDLATIIEAGDNRPRGAILTMRR